MLQPINMEQAKIWNERFAQKMQEHKFSQREFAAEFKNAYGTGSQADVSKWMHVGEKDYRTGKERGFPSFETMRKIAKLLDVSVGYLIGETNCKTFEMEDATRFLGLSEPVIEAVQGITSGTSLRFSHPEGETTAALELFLASPFLIEYLKKVVNLQNAVESQKHPINHLQKVLAKIPEEYRNEAFVLWECSRDTVENGGVSPTPELWQFVDHLETASELDMHYKDILPEMVSSAKYELNETHIKMIAEMITTDSVTIKNIK